MSLTRRIGLGITLDVDAAGGTTWVNVASIVDELGGPEAKAEIVPIPLLSEAFRRKAKGEIDGGQVSFQIAYDPDDDTTLLLSSLLRQRSPVPSWRISYPDASTPETFSAHLSSMGRTVAKSGYLVAPITLDVDGDPGFPST